MKPSNQEPQLEIFHIISQIIDNAISQGFFKIRLYQDSSFLRSLAVIGKDKHYLGVFNVDIKKLINIFSAKYADECPSLIEPNKLQEFHVRNLKTNEFTLNAHMLSFVAKEDGGSWIDLEFYSIRDTNGLDITSNFNRFNPKEIEKHVYDIILDSCSQDSFNIHIVSEDISLRNATASFIASLHESTMDEEQTLATCILTEEGNYSAKDIKLSDANIVHQTRIKNTAENEFKDIIAFKPDVIFYSLAHDSSLPHYESNKFRKEICLFSEETHKKALRKSNPDLTVTITPTYKHKTKELSYTVIANPR